MQDRLGLGRSPIEFDHLHHHPGLGRERDSSKFRGSGSLATRLRRVDGEGLARENRIECARRVGLRQFRSVPRSVRVSTTPGSRFAPVDQRKTYDITNHLAAQPAERGQGRSDCPVRSPITPCSSNLPISYSSHRPFIRRAHTHASTPPLGRNRICARALALLRTRPGVAWPGRSDEYLL
ncbi:hypothetical protein OH76DRAFT_1130262 [Lentinus brumalis]|uniref:Uncharacterized protein n=1 Tax=Lentinus brumalis TaxID=2498619 RepID=A0A371CUH9_9APHY|nr:hypothetical protein OH76DRAFT_1130262 [Polyporus brumalis]